MLVLGRKPGQSIKVGNDITIHIIVNDRGNVKVGIEAPKDVPIVRTELVGREYKKAKE